MTEIQPITPEARADIDLAVLHLQTARDLLVQAKAPQAAKATRRALKSAEGAQRHARRRPLAN